MMVFEDWNFLMWVGVFFMLVSVFLLGFFVGDVVGFSQAVDTTMKANGWHRTLNGWYKETP